MKKQYTKAFGIRYISALAVVSVSMLNIGSAHAMITTHLDLGESGSQVTELQQFLAASPSLYPSGLVTGYFGALTQAGVQRFQAAQGIVSSGSPGTTGYGRVGPTTMNRINSLLGGGPQASVDPSPLIFQPSLSISDRSTTLNWVTSEESIAQVYYDTKPLVAYEATGPRQQPYVSGNLVVVNGGYQTSPSVTLQNLQPDTTYYFLTRAIDRVGNMSMTWPSSFTTQD